MEDFLSGLPDKKLNVSLMHEGRVSFNSLLEVLLFAMACLSAQFWCMKGVIVNESVIKLLNVV